MGKRENVVETYLDEQVEEKLGGITRKWVCPGRDGVPDRIVITKAGIIFVEVKSVDGSRSPEQVREHTRLINASANVYTVYGNAGVDAFIKSHTPFRAKNC